jgi:hypothetical protein
MSAQRFQRIWHRWGRPKQVGGSKRWRSFLPRKGGFLGEHSLCVAGAFCEVLVDELPTATGGQRVEYVASDPVRET